MRRWRWRWRWRTACGGGAPWPVPADDDETHPPPERISSRRPTGRLPAGAARGAGGSPVRVRRADGGRSHGASGVPPIGSARPGLRRAHIGGEIMTETAIADHGLIGDLQTAPLVTIDGSIDWFCAPRFDPPACSAPCSRQGGVRDARDPPPAVGTGSRSLLEPLTTLVPCRDPNELLFTGP